MVFNLIAYQNLKRKKKNESKNLSFHKKIFKYPTPSIFNFVKIVKVNFQLLK